VALGNTGDRGAVPALVGALGDPDADVRGHAAWALGRLGGPDARASLQVAREREPEDEVRREMETALANVDERSSKADAR
jgi:epoxyqueuosine reductase